MKKKQRCLLKRFAALVAALMLCASLCVPCFASNNASTQKWYIAESQTMTTESGQSGTYFRLTPYVNGVEFTYTSLSQLFKYNAYASSSDASGQYPYTGVLPLNWPDWWRADIPLGNTSYVSVRLVTCEFAPSLDGPWTSVSSYGRFHAFDLSNAAYLTWGGSYPYSNSSKGQLNSTSFSSHRPFFFTQGYSLSTSPSQYHLEFAPGINANVGTSYFLKLSDFKNLAVAPSFAGSDSTDYVAFPSVTVVPLSNLKSSDLVLCFSSTDSYKPYCRATFNISFWVGADKLPAGLKVGDEFPANDDAFDNLRDELLKQFPEASENIENGKDTINGWNDTETVDTDVANTSLSAINAIFQNLGQFLAIVSLMIFGAVVLRMLVRKAVDG